jgi:anti-anti-sigma regulatory factor
MRLPLSLAKWGTVTMLRISKLTDLRGTTVRLDGRLSGVCIDQLRALCTQALAVGETLTIDCGGVDFSDPDGVKFMCEMASRKVALVNCSPLLAFQIKQHSTVDWIDSM